MHIRRKGRVYQKIPGLLWMGIPDNNAATAEKQSFCISSMLIDGINTNTDGYEVPKKGFALMSHQNQYDAKLYEYARDTLFVDQTKRYGSKEWKKAEKVQQKSGVQF